MRVAVVSDLHANLQAWMAVASDLAVQRVDQIVSLGDLFGYGPNPLEVCLLARSRIQTHLLGNHDAALCGRTTLENWNSRAVRSLEWTRKRLDGTIIDWLSALPLTLSWAQCRFAHAEFSCPERFYYVKVPEHALLSWRSTPEPLLFVGHTHRPALYVIGPSGVPHVLEPQPFVLETGKRYLVNVGSVGFPRDRLDVASYCIYDTDQNSVCWQHVSFDCRTYRIALNSQGFTDPRNMD